MQRRKYNRAKGHKRTAFFRRGAVHMRKIKIENLTKKICLMCNNNFDSEGSHNRICIPCKSTDDWYYGNDYSIMRQS